MVLSEVRNNGIYHVRQLHDGAGDIHRHLENLGFVPGEQIVVVSRIGGNLIVNTAIAAAATSGKGAEGLGLNIAVVNNDYNAVIDGATISAGRVEALLVLSSEERMAL